MNNDKVLKEKLNSLDTLSSGIVFGKEEAWDKLQARMDKPAKRIALMPWLAAAAVLLLIVTVITAYYNIPEEQEIAKEGHNVVTNTPQPLAAPQPVVQAIENNISIIHKSVKEKQHKRPVIQEQEKQIIKTEPIQVADAIPTSAPVDEVPIMNNTTLAVTSKIPTRVVHINELKEGIGLPETVVVLEKNPPLDLKILSVVHLNDMMRDERTIQHIKRENTFGIGLLSFRKPRTQYQYNSMSESPNNNANNNPLQIKINLQN